MVAKLDFRWHLRQLMATRGMFSTTDLRPLLAQRGVELSPSQVYRLVTEKPERLSMRTLLALVDILDCAMDELIEPVAAAKPRRKAAAERGGADAGVGAFRPKRARVTPDPQ
jgi:DNA-binding Xre family transcriptional regulator